VTNRRSSTPGFVSKRRSLVGRTVFFALDKAVESASRKAFMEGSRDGTFKSAAS
jgi:hypothetical protein